MGEPGNEVARLADEAHEALRENEQWKAILTMRHATTLAILQAARELRRIAEALEGIRGERDAR